MLTISILWSGAYYEYISAILGVLAAIIVLSKYRKTNNIQLGNSFVLFPLLLVGMYLISCLYAVDSGMALTGAAKKMVLLLFAICLCTLTVKQRKKIIRYLPEAAVGTTIIGAIGMAIPFFHENIIHAGRFCGTFGYANTYALFMLLGLVVLFYRLSKEHLVLQVAMLFVMLAGLWFSGSRFSWIILFLLLIIIAMTKKKLRLWVAGFAGVLFTLTIVVGIVGRQSMAMGRFFSTNLSTLFGRLLYWQDGLSMALKHPFGTGYLGFYYEQSSIQTGVYSVRYVHNDMLQWVMDIGWLPAAILIFILIRALINKKRSAMEKVLLFTLMIHSFMEFDFEHTAIALIWIVVLSCTEEKIFSRMQMKPLVVRSFSLVAGLFCLYMSLPLSVYAAGNTMLAAKLYPIYTDAQLANLSLETDIEAGNREADKILAQNDYAFLAYDMKAQVAFSSYQFDDMAAYKKKAIERNKFNATEYTDYLAMLNEVLAYSEQVGDEHLTEDTTNKINEVPVLMEKSKATISALGNKIDDKISW